MCFITSNRSTLAQQDDPDEMGTGHCLPHPFAEVGVSPTSGAGAGLYGGRASRPGVPALYLALDTQTAIQEYKQLSPLMLPGTLVSYTVRLDQVVDFSGDYDRSSWSPLWEDFSCDWRKLWFDERTEPPSWF